MAAATLQPARAPRGVDWPVVDARLSQRERRSATSYLDSRLGPRNEPASVTLGGYEVTPFRPMTVARRPREVEGVARPRRRRHHVDQSEHARIVRRGDHRDRRGGARGRRTALLRRRESQRDSGCRATGRHGFRHRAHEPAQDLRHAHGGGGPGAGPVAVSKRLVEFLPGPKATRLDDGTFAWVKRALHRSGPRLARQRHGVGARSRLHRRARRRRSHEGREVRVLNANWLRQRLSDTLPAPTTGVCMHECVLTATR